MKLALRSADLESDRSLIIELLFKYLTPLSNDTRYEWLYLNNPHGGAQVWIASRSDTGEAVGTAAAFPRRIYVNGAEESCWVLGDFCIKDQYRSLGPALQLHRASLAAVDSGLVPFLYDFPSESMMAVYKRLGINPYGKLQRLAKPLRADRKIGELVKPAWLARALARPANLLLAHWARPSHGDETLAVSVLKDDCDEEFSELDTQLRSQYGIRTRRCAKYLNWRYLHHPTSPCQLLTIRRQGVLLAYLAFRQEGENATVVDVFGIDEPDIITFLIKNLTELLRQRKVVAISAPMFESHRWITLMQRLGFRIREEMPVIGYARDSFWLKCDAGKGVSWLLTDGDRDI